MLNPSSISWNDVPVSVLRGPDEILPLAPLLEKLALQCDQPAAMSGLKYVLLGPGHRQKRRTLVLFHRPGSNPKALREGDLLACVLTFEVLLCGLPTGAFSTNDRSSTRTVVAPSGEHGRVAVASTEVLFRHGAHVVLTSHLRSSADEVSPGIFLETPSVVWGERHRVHRQQMKLADTYEGVLANLGKTTRAHMRYYRKRLQALFELEFVEDVRQVISETEFATFNLQSRYAPRPEECGRRWRIPDEPGGFMVGLRTAQGEWLSIVGGWRQAGTMMVDYQVNTEAYPKESVSSVMRTFLIETEVARGSKFFCIHTGTPHSMANSFDEMYSNELVAYRNTLQFRALRSLAKLIEKRRAGSITRLAKAMIGDGREWNVVPAGVRRPTGQMLDAHYTLRR